MIRVIELLVKYKFILSLIFLVGTLTCVAQDNKIEASGNVGVGTTNPSEKLHVNGNLRLHQTGNKIFWDWGSRAIEQYSSGGISRSIRFTNSWGGSNPDGGFDFAFYDGTSILRIINHKVGILNTNPQEALDVNGKARLKNAIIVNGIDSGNPSAQVEQLRLSGYGILGNRGTMYISNENAQGSLKFYVGGKHGSGSHLLINNDGFVGIGTENSAGFKLGVNGAIRAKEIKVETAWSDYVFEKDYSLPTLEEVELYINQFGHLKDIPSAKDVEENGIFLGEMDAKLLQKIEELTLYIIEQNKKINQLNERIDSLVTDDN